MSNKTYNGINLNHYVSSNPLLLTQKLFENTEVVSFFNYSRVFPNGDVIDVGLGNIWNDWMIRYEEKYLQNITLTHSRLHCGINYWRKSNNQYLSRNANWPTGSFVEAMEFLAN